MTKAADAFRTISEAASELDLPQHVLRFWETRFHQIKPMKRGGGRRYYRPDDIVLLSGIKHLLYDEGYTIKGVQRILKEEGTGVVLAVGRGGNLAEIMAEKNNGQTEAAKVEAPTEASTAQPEASPDEPLPDDIAPADKAGGMVGFAKSVLPRRARENLPLHGLSGDDRKELQTTLFELLECKRILDQAR